MDGDGGLVIETNRRVSVRTFRDPSKLREGVSLFYCYNPRTNKGYERILFLDGEMEVFHFKGRWTPGVIRRGEVDPREMFGEERFQQLLREAVF